MKTFTYTRQVGPSYYSARTDEEFYDEESFEYQVSDEDVKEALIDIVFDDYFSMLVKSSSRKESCLEVKKQIGKMIEDLDMQDILEEIHEDALKDVFEEQAMNWINGY